MKKSVVFTTTAATLGLATVLTLTAVVPSEAKVRHNSTTRSASAKSNHAKSSFRVRTASTGTNTGSGSTWSPSGATGGSGSSTPEAQRQFTTVNFTVNNVPSTITDAATAAQLLVVKVVPLAADATAAPATPPVPAFGPGDGNGPRHHGGHGDGDHGGNGWTPSGTNGTPAPTPGATPPAAPDNDGDGPAAGTAPAGAPAGAPAFDGHRGHGMQISNLTLTNGVLTGTIQIPGDEIANVQNWGIYLSIAADSTNGIVAQSADPVMVTVTTAADLSATVTATTGDIVLNLPTA